MTSVVFQPVLTVQLHGISDTATNWIIDQLRKPTKYENHKSWKYKEHEMKKNANEGS